MTDLSTETLNSNYFCHLELVDKTLIAVSQIFIIGGAVADSSMSNNSFAEAFDARTGAFEFVADYIAGYGVNDYGGLGQCYKTFYHDRWR